MYMYASLFTNSMVYNKTHKKLVIVTFNYADMLYTRYNNYYTLEPGEKIQVCKAGGKDGRMELEKYEL